MTAGTLFKNADVGAHVLPNSPKPTSWSLRLAIPGVLLAILCLLPYLKKAYTIDDPVFLLEARQILRNPLRPFSYPMCWQDNESCATNCAEIGRAHV